MEQGKYLILNYYAPLLPLDEVFSYDPETESN
jgi:hypothetical protein